MDGIRYNVFRLLMNRTKLGGGCGQRHTRSDANQCYDVYTRAARKLLREGS